MAILDLLKGSFTQKLGETYGSKWKNQTVIKAVPFSKAPPTKLQTQNVRAFECLNRLSSAIARLGFEYTGLDAKNIHKHNAVARFLKPAIKNHLFEPSNIKEAISPGKDIYITALSFNRATNTVILGLDVSAQFVPIPGQKAFFLVFDNKGRTYFTRLFDPARFSASFILDYTPGMVYYAIVFLSTPAKKGFILDNFNIMEGLRMAYSLEEQPTGETHINGKPIFQKSYNTGFSLGNSTSTTIDLGIIPNLSAIIRHEFVYSGSLNYSGIPVSRDIISMGISSGSTPTVSSMFTLILNALINTKMVQLQVFSTSTNVAASVIVTIWYTK